MVEPLWMLADLHQGHLEEHGYKEAIFTHSGCQMKNADFYKMVYITSLLTVTSN